jgi:acetylornithine/succinyldiaminopimelate/putrescine aminotransferase
MRLAPPLTISENEIEKAIGIILAACDTISKKA